MIRSLIEEAPALASLTLFIGMVVIWAQVISTLKPPPCCDRDAYRSRPGGLGAKPLGIRRTVPSAVASTVDSGAAGPSRCCVRFVRT